MKYPTVIIDNFFDNPDKMVEYSKTLKYHIPRKDEWWIGKRSELLHKINPDLFNFICTKILATFYDSDLEEVKWEDAQIQFQIITREDINKTKVLAHKDIGNSLSGIIYLSKNESLSNGTKILKDENTDKILVSSIYNTLLCYEGSQIHAPIGASEEERLTIVFFIHDIKANVLPYDRINRVKGF